MATEYSYWKLLCVNGNRFFLEEERKYDNLLNQFSSLHFETIVV